MVSLNSKYGIATDRNHITFFGVLTPRKNVELIIKGFGKVASEFPEWELVFAGGVSSHFEGYEKRLQSLASNLGIEDQVVWTGYIDADDIPEVLMNADILVQTPNGRPSASGPISLGIGYHLPMLLTEVDVYQERLTHMESAYFVEAAPDAIASGISELIEDEVLRRKISKGAETVADKYSWSKTASKTKKIYKSYL